VLKLTAYLDESQVTEQTGHVVVAGFYGEDHNWNAFSGEWQTVLSRRQKQHLHMTDLRWNHKKAEQRVKPLLAELGPLPYKYNLMPLRGAVKVSHYADMLNSEGQAILSGYNYCFSRILGHLCVDLPAHASLRMVCEEQVRHQGLASKMFHVVGKRMARHPENAWLDSFMTVRKGSTFMTEPADYLAFAIGKFLDERNSTKDIWCRSIYNEVPPEKFIRVHPKNRVREGMRIVLDSSKRNESVFESKEFGLWLKTQGMNQANMKSLIERFRS
jgi:hypothetical protein